MLEPDVKEAARGEVEAFQRLYRRHVARVYTLARRMLGSSEEAEDATQEIFLRAWGALGAFRGEASFATWLHRLARNWILNRLRRDPGRLEVLAEEEGALDMEREEVELRLDLQAGIASLPTCARVVFVLHDVEGLKHREISELVGISVGTSKSQLHRARMLLRRHFSGGPS